MNNIEEVRTLINTQLSYNREQIKILKPSIFLYKNGVLIDNGEDRQLVNKYKDSNDSLEITLESLDGPEANGFKGEMYFLTMSHKDNIVMSMCCFPNMCYKFQFNMLITKYWNVSEIPKNISMLMHSYAASLFECNYILVRPLEKMGQILMKEFPNLWIVKKFGDLLGCNDSDIDDAVGIEKGSPTYVIKITEELRGRYLKRDDLKFNLLNYFE